MTKHTLKTVQPFFNDILSGEKTFESRRDDRGFEVGDELELVEYLPRRKTNKTGRRLRVEVTYCLRDPKHVKRGFVIMGIKF